MLQRGIDFGGFARRSRLFRLRRGLGGDKILAESGSVPPDKERAKGQEIRRRNQRDSIVVSFNPVHGLEGEADELDAGGAIDVFGADDEGERGRAFAARCGRRSRRRINRGSQLARRTLVALIFYIQRSRNEELLTGGAELIQNASR